MIIVKTNNSIQQNIRRYVEDRILGNLYSDKKRALKWILQRFEDYDKKLTIDSLIELSSEYSVDTKRTYEDLGLKEIMSYSKFVFEIPKIWYATLFRLIQEWEADSSEAELAY